KEQKHPEQQHLLRFSSYLYFSYFFHLFGFVFLLRLNLIFYFKKNKLETNRPKLITQPFTTMLPYDIEGQIHLKSFLFWKIDDMFIKE
ncbi:MAG: hypothetical protein PHR48_03900, partial [Candidatus ainarchaeum sp.]|nr:hypothetical protein [Candidatus ainarchaeum sp.]